MKATQMTAEQRQLGITAARAIVQWRRLQLHTQQHWLLHNTGRCKRSIHSWLSPTLTSCSRIFSFTCSSNSCLSTALCSVARSGSTGTVSGASLSCTTNGPPVCTGRACGQQQHNNSVDRRSQPWDTPTTTRRHFNSALNKSLLVMVSVGVDGGQCAAFVHVPELLSLLHAVYIRYEASKQYC
jgi:hypothetical protein